MSIKKLLAEVVVYGNTHNGLDSVTRSVSVKEL